MKHGYGQKAALYLALLAFYSAVTAAMFFTVLAHISTQLAGPAEDNLQDFWNLWYVTAGASSQHFFHTTFLRYPEGVSLLYHSFAYPQLTLAWLITKITGTSHATLITLFNLIQLSSLPIAALGGFCLTRHFIRHNGAACVGGFIFAFNPPHIEMVLHHTHVAQIGLIPFFVLAWLITIERKSIRWLIVSILLYALNALSCWYYLFYLGYFVIFYALWRSVQENHLPAGWNLTAPLLCFTGTALALSPLIIPMVLQTSGHAYYGGNNTLVADLTGFFIFPHQHLLSDLSQKFYLRYSGNPWENVVYLGWANLVLLCWWLWHRRHTPPDATRSFVISGIITFSILALGDSLHVLGHDYSFIHLPNILLAHLPFASNARTPARIIVLAYLFLSIGVAAALRDLWQAHGTRIKRTLIVLIIFLIGLDFWPTRIATTPAACPRILAPIAQDTSHSGVLNMPLLYVEANRAMFLQSCHHKPVVAAIVSRVLHPTLLNRLEQKDLTRQQQQLTRNKVKYILFATPALAQHACRSEVSLAGHDVCRTIGTYYAIKSAYEKHYRVLDRDKNFTLMQVY